MTEPESLPPNFTVRWAHAAVGGLLGGILTLPFAMGNPVDWLTIGLGTLVGAALFFWAGTWLLSAITEYFRWF